MQHNGARSGSGRRAASGQTHLDFTDLVFWGGPLAARRLPGALAPERVTTILRTVVREFFDRELLERDSSLLRGDGSIPEITVRRLP